MSGLRTHDLFAKNRAEELGFDVWQHFVVPPFFERLSLGISKKPKVIVGGRGCGKTMLLRYLSHDSTFSSNRNAIPLTAIEHIGLYWRSDTQFARLMQYRGVDQEKWYAAFKHLASVVIGIEILRSIESIAHSSLDIVDVPALERLDFRRIAVFDHNLPRKLRPLRESLEDKLAEFETWVNDIDTVAQPRFLPGDALLKRLIQLVSEQLPALKHATFYVYIDEYENLAEYQQQLVNTWLKHSAPPLIFNLATKRNGFKTRATVGEESLSDIHDFRDIDLEDYDLEREFPAFAAEILLLHLNLAGIAAAPIDPNSLRDPSQLCARQTPEYVASVLGAVNVIFPSLSERELAEHVLQDRVLKQRLMDRVERVLRQRNESVPGSIIVRDEYPAASIVAAALITRDSLNISEIVIELDKLARGEQSRFERPTDWIHNNFVGCLLLLYDGLLRACPFFGGFETFCYMSRGNLRHFLELCHQSIARSRKTGSDSKIAAIPIETQAEAARAVSTELLTEIKSFGPQGTNLHTFVLRLGSLFSLSQQSPSQSEPEKTHFSIQGGDSELNNSERAFLSEAVKWSVLFEERETKKKSANDPETAEFVLNPIYSPYFHISYRKRRKLEVSADQAKALIGGSYDDIKRLLRAYRSKWSVDPADASRSLFAHLDLENAP